MNLELKRLFDEDQAAAGRSSNSIEAFRNVDWETEAVAVGLRHFRCEELLREGLIETGDAKDFKHAGYILQHVPGTANFLRAHQLAKRAADLDPTDVQALNLVANSYDRYLLSIGKAQIYGTQFYVSDDHVCLQQPCNLSAVNDEERRRLFIMTRSETAAYLKRLR